MTWHLPLMAVVCLGAALWAVGQLITDNRPRPTAASTESVPRARRFQPELVSLGLLAFCCMLAEGAMADWSANYLEKVAKAGRYWAPIGLAAFTAAMTIGRFLGDHLRLRLGDERLMRAGSFTALSGLAIALLWPVFWTGTLGFFLVGAGLSSIVPIAYSTAGKAPGLAPGVGISAVSTIGYAGFLLGPPVIGYISDYLGLRVGLSFVWLLLAVMAIMSVSLTVRKARREQAETAVRLAAKRQKEAYSLP